MKKLLALTLISVSLFGCSNQVTQTLDPVDQNTSISSKNSQYGDLIDEKYQLKKDATIQRVMNNTITVKADDINKDKNALLIYFSQGNLTPNSYFKLVMDIKVNDDQFGKRGNAGIFVQSSYFGGFNLTKDETVKILKSAINYSQYASQLDKILK